MADIGKTLWHGCHTLRSDGIGHTDYIDQLTLLLFLKMIYERGGDSDLARNWRELEALDDQVILKHYDNTLEQLGKQPGLVGDIFLGARSAFSRASSLRRIMGILQAVQWTDFDQDVQGAAFEYLLERSAAEGKQGAGQYFTPRPLVKVIVECVKPGLTQSASRIADPAAGTGGFLTQAAQWWNERQRTGLQASESIQLRGTELVPRVRRLALMNLLLHGVHDGAIKLGDALSAAEETEIYDVILTNPPFGSRGGEVVSKPSFWYVSANKQVSFVQEAVRRLRPGGRAAIVLPDGCFFGENGRRLWPELLNRCNVHTILRLPRGTFAPYTSGTMTNVIFMTKGNRTERVWTYDARVQWRAPSTKQPLRFDEFEEFIRCFGADPDGGSSRQESQSTAGRWQAHSITDIEADGFDLGKIGLMSTPLASGPSYQEILAQLGSELTAALASVRRLEDSL